MKSARGWIIGLVALCVAAGLGFLIVRKLREPALKVGHSDGPAAVPVETAPITVGDMQDRRVFSGALEATARVTIAPKVAGRVIALPVDLSDVVERGQVVARLDSAEFEQAVAQAEAELAVARATLVEAESAVGIAQRELERTQTLNERGIASDSQFDTVRAGYLSKAAAVEVAKAQVTRAEAAAEGARIRRGYTTIRAEWEEGDNHRVVAQRFVEEGDTVAANTPLLTIVDLDPINAIIYATERDYASLNPGQVVGLTTDAFQGRRWSGRVARIAPVFREGSRQARVEVAVPNEGGALKPGMFVRVEATLGEASGATIVPVEALLLRDGRTVVFVVEPGASVARMVPVTTGIRDGGRVQILGEALRGRVVTLGQQLLADGSRIFTPQPSTAEDAGGAGGAGGAANASDPGDG